MTRALAATVRGVEGGGSGESRARVASLMTWALVLLLVWLPLQTPIAVAIFQYGHSTTLARAVLLLKDAAVALLVLSCLAATWRQLKLRWFDKVAIAYVVLVVVYSVIPVALGSSQSITGVVSSARQFVLPVEAYALGRLAVLAGADVKLVFKAFVAASAVVAAIGVAEYFLLPIDFWASTLDLVTFERVAQGIPAAVNLWKIGLLGEYGAGTGAYPRSIATFPHPVGAGLYFLLPFGLSVAAWFGGEARGRRLAAVGLVVLTLLFGMATIVTISRAAWAAAAAVLLMCGLAFHRTRMAIACVLVAGVFVAGVPPFNESITSALNRDDASILGHIEAIGRDLEAGLTHFLGLGLGSADRVVMIDSVPDHVPTTSGDTGTGPVGGAESVGLGENMYLSVLISAGPLGLLTLVVWCVGVIAVLLRAARGSPQKWLLVGTASALIGALAAAMSSSALMRFTTAASTWLLLGLATSLVLALNPDAGAWRIGFGRLRRRRRKESGSAEGEAA